MVVVTNPRTGEKESRRSNPIQDIIDRNKPAPTPIDKIVSPQEPNVKVIVTEPKPSSGGGSSRNRNKPETAINPDMEKVPVYEPIPEPNPARKVELYYDISDPTKQYSTDAGKYGQPKLVVPNPIVNPQNVETNTNMGQGYVAGRKKSGVQSGVYTSIEDTQVQYTKPESNFGATPEIVTPTQYSITVPAPKGMVDKEGNVIESTTYTYRNIPDVTSVRPNRNLPSENRFQVSNVDWKAGLEGSQPRRDEFGRLKITPQTYADYQFQEQTSKLNPYTSAVAYALTYNTMTKKFDKENKIYKFVESKPNFSAVNTAKFIAFAPYMETGAQTYKGVFGGENVVSSEKQIYLSPIERIKVPEVLTELAKQKSASVGAPFVKPTEDGTFIFNIAGKKAAGGESVTLTSSIISPSGVNRASIFQKGITLTNVESLSGNTFTYVRPFVFQGRITDIAPTFVEVSQKGVSMGYEDAFIGKVEGKYYPSGSKNPIDVKGITGISRPSGEGFDYTIALKDKNSFVLTSKLKLGNQVSTKEVGTFTFDYDLIGTGKVFDYVEKPATNTIIQKGNKLIGKSTVTAEDIVKILKDVPKEITKSGNSNMVVKVLPSNVETTNILSTETINKAGAGISTILTGKSEGALFTSPSAIEAASKSGVLFAKTQSTNVNQNYKQQVGFDLAVDTRYNLATKSIVDVSNVQDVVQGNGSRTRVIQTQDIAQTQTQVQQQETRLDTPFKRTFDIFKPNPNVNVRPNIEPPQFIPKKKAPNEILSKIKQAFDVAIFKGGKEQIIAKGLPEGLARKVGVKNVLETLRASFKLKPRGTTTSEDVTYKLPRGFKTSKYDKNRFVQVKNLRFGARAETKEAQFFRKKAKGSAKWF
jgi:hypothetical protein